LQRVLVTGGAGFIGTHLVHEMSRGCDIYIVDSLTNERSRSNVETFSGDNITLYQEDIRNKDKLIDIFRDSKADSCIHLAAQISVTESMANPFKTFDVNVKGTLNTLEACVESSIKHFVFASSSAVYGDVSSVPINENIGLHPISPYGASKLAAEEIVNAYSDLDKFDSIISLRFFNVYGRGQNMDYAGVITKFRDRLANNLCPIIYGDGNQQRDFIVVDDVVSSLIIASNPPRGVDKGTFNIGTGVPTKISDLAKIMSILMGKAELAPIYKPRLDGDIHASYADITKATNILNFCAKGELSGGLEAFLSSP
jgi:nucleoside-diphosphate-sugar epimerase